MVFFSGLFSANYVLAEGGSARPSLPDIGVTTTIESANLVSTIPLMPENIPESAGNTGKYILDLWKNHIAPILQQMAVSAIFDLVSYSADTVAYNAAVWIANGAPGEEPLYQVLTGYESWKAFGLDLAAEGLGSLSNVIVAYTDLDFNLCAPSSPALRLGLQIGIQGMYAPRPPKCEWQAVAENWDGFIQNTLESTEDPTGQALNMLAKSFQPGQSSVAYLSIVNNKILEKSWDKKNADFMESLFSLGIKPVTDPTTGAVLTPSVMVQQQLKSAAEEATTGKRDKFFATMLANQDIWTSIAYQTVKIFTTTLVGTFIQNLQTGFFEAEDIDIDPFDDLSQNSSTSADAEVFYADLISTTPVVLSEYNVLSELAVCPQSPSIRQINNCVADASLIQGIGRTFGTEVITVADALEAGYLHGDWPLYSPDDRIHNQDSLCYTYGYCYGNLVKLRKARIIPVGWEMAAALSDTSDPITLQEVVDNFNSCDSEGKASSSLPWCHMIDPNWIIKYPQQRCDASMIGELSISSMISARSAACVDSPSCLAENDDGTCEAYGNCVREKNTWDFNGDSCPEESLSCLNFTNSDSNEIGTWLFNSLDQGVCSAANAGCLWYRTNKYLDNAGTADDVSDDAYEWLPGDEVYETSIRDDSEQYYSNNSYSTRASFTYDTDADGVDDDGSYNVYAYEDRAYFNSEVETCTESEAGCSEVYAIGDNELSLNIIQNPSFEDDEDEDGLADLWSVSTVSPPVYNENDSLSQQGNSNYLLSVGSVLSQDDIPLQQNHSYVLSFYAKGAAVGNVVTASLTLSASDNSVVSLTGYSSNCTTSAGNSVTKSATTTSVSVFTSYECTFNTPILTNDRLWIVADLSFSGAPTLGTYIDAIQLEARETASSFHSDYNGSPTAEYLQIPPDWLGCTGEATDPADCDSYAQLCSATEVGCSLYTPSDGDPAVPAVISDGDQCPSECVGYATYKQESTDYDTEEFPLYFIADSAQTCSSSDVGCDEFTNLETEGIEAYSHLRACLTPEMADVNNVDRSAVYFTWEGSDMTGYQLVSYQLLSSNLTTPAFVDTDLDNVLDATEFSILGNAPCTTWDVTSENTLVCQDSITVLAAETTCRVHGDVLINPDCREFYDNLGDIHYRLYSETISISDVCTAYRKTDANATDCNDSGGYWTGSGECRYFIEPDESTVCSASSAGCREYTGGGSRNSSIVLTDYFEDGTYDSYVKSGTTNSTLTISNESVAVDGHSLRVYATAAGDGFKTLQDYYNANRTSACATADGCASSGTLCTVENGAESCGTLVDELVVGKTYVLKFWAKGSGNIGVALTEQGGTTGGIIRDLAAAVPDCETAPNLSVPNCQAAPTSIANLTSVALSGSWQLYELGPLDTSLLTNFDDNAILGFYSLSAGAQTFYIDNIQLKQTEENLTLIKNSWVTPSTCDETPEGAVSAQYYLGCEEYADQNNSTFNIYQFSSICSEGAVGCDDFYVTQNSDATYAQIFNATCYNPVSTDGDTNFAYTAHDTEEDAVASATSCTLDGTLTGQELCTITAGHNQCQFDYDGTLPTPLAVHLALGPETVFVPADEVAYLIDDGNFSCSAANMGCTEVGLPTFSDDGSLVTSFESAYLLNQPDSYDDILCNNNELFCGEWVTTKAENYYFKDPGNKSCEYKSGVSLNSVSYDGWFRTGTTEFCYGTGICSDNTTSCTNDAGCASSDLGTCTITNGSYLKNGTLSSLWFSGDDDYDGWAGTCSSNYDYCTEFIDPLDTKENENLEGTSYFYLDNETIDEENSTSTDRCNGQVSLQEGCVLFDDVMNQELTYSSSPSYLISEHADIFFGENPRSFQDPVSCSDPNNGEFTTTTGDSINVCYNRCAYFVSTGSGISNLSTVEGPANSAGTSTVFYGSACVYDTDCQLGTDSISNNEVEGICANLDSDNDGSVGNDEAVFDSNDDGIVDAVDDRHDFNLAGYVFEDDTNRVLKVYRDRECAEWLACSDSYDAWDERTAEWTDVCQGVNLCNAYSTTSDEGACASWSRDVPTVLDSERYTSRDVSWYGMDYSGFAIPEQLPVQYYDQVNLSSGGYCTNSDGEIPYYLENPVVSCSVDADCPPAQGYVCTDVLDLNQADLENYDIELNNYHLVYTASACNGNNGDTCTAGYCTDSGNSCSDSNECSQGGECIIGYCEEAGATYCSVDLDCTTLPYNDCKNGVCTDTTTGTANSVETCDQTGTHSCSGGATCVPGVLAKTGTCYDSSCLVGIDGNAFEIDDAEDKTCRGYPEISSPFTYLVVENWIDPDELGDVFDDNSLNNYGEISGFLSDRYATYSCDSDDDGTTDETCYTRDKYLDALPYTYVYGFNNATTCAPTILPDGSYEINNDCLCSYDKAEYGESAAVRYYPLNTPTELVLSGVCVGGDVPGASCEDDVTCNPSALVSDGYPGTGICQKLTRKDVMYGWDGYCIERDTSIQLFGSDTNDYPACLTWFPSDQLIGSRNAYANDTDAGFGINEESYYCTELGLYADLYPTGVTIDEIGGVEEMDYACAFSDPNQIHGETGRPGRGGCFYSLYGGADGQDTTHYCQNNAYCPGGYVAIMGVCNQDMDPDDAQTQTMYPFEGYTNELDRSSGDYVNDIDWPGEHTICHDDDNTGNPDDTTIKANGTYLEDNVLDCPYFCIPLDSYHIEGDDVNTSCNDDLESLESVYYSSSDYADEIDGGLGSEISRFDTPVITAYDLYNYQTADTGWDWAEGYSVKTKFMDCVRRGVPVGDSTIGTNLTEAVQDVVRDGDNAGITSGYFYAYGDGLEHGAYGVSYLPILGQIGSCSETGGICYSSGDCLDISSNDCSCTGFECGGSCSITYGSCDEDSIFCPTSQSCILPSQTEIFGSFFPYVGCYELTEVSNITDGNKAWANRLWNDAPSLFTSVTGDSGSHFADNYDYTSESDPDNAGRALFKEYFGLNTPSEMLDFADSWPLPVASCGSNSLGLYIKPPNDCLDSYDYPKEQQWQTVDDDELTNGGSYSVLAAPFEEWTAGDSSDIAQGGISEDGFDDQGLSSNETAYSVKELLQQWFAKVFDVWQYDWDAGLTSNGAYVQVGLSATYSDLVTDGTDDISGTGDIYGSGPNSGTPTPPVIASVGECYDSNCLELNQGKFSVNGFDSDDLLGSDGNYHAAVKFYAWANSNQMPIRNVIVDWGDGDRITESAGYNWPPDSQTGDVGSTSSYYKNRRGLEEEDVTICGGGATQDPDEWGLTADACETAYFSFEHDYYCSQDFAQMLFDDDADQGKCQWADEATGRLLNSPCTGNPINGVGFAEDAAGKCVYQPRVHVKDNWGWCTGYCDAGTEDADTGEGTGCYGEECNPTDCPSEASSNWCVDALEDRVGDIANPWINYDGVIIVDWATQ